MPQIDVHIVPSADAADRHGRAGPAAAGAGLRQCDRTLTGKRLRHASTSEEAETWARWLITGAGGGIGAATVRAALKAGDRGRCDRPQPRQAHALPWTTSQATTSRSSRWTSPTRPGEAMRSTRRSSAFGQHRRSRQQCRLQPARQFRGVEHGRNRKRLIATRFLRRDVRACARRSSVMRKQRSGRIINISSACWDRRLQALRSLQRC